MYRESKEPFMLFVWVLFAMALVAGAGYAWKYYMAPIAGKADAEWQQESGVNRTAQYDHYFDLCASIQGYEATIRAQTMALTQTAGKDDHSRISTVLGAVRAQRGRAIAQYNADVRKVYTSGRFLDPSLPKQLNDGAEQTLCVN